MKTRKKSTGIFLVILLGGILGVLSIIYAAVSLDLQTVTSNATLQPWRVIYDTSYNSVSAGNNTQGTISVGESSITISNISLNNANSPIYYYFRVKNAGTVPAKLNRINCTMSTNGGTSTTTSLSNNVKVDVYYTTNISSLGTAKALNTNITGTGISGGNNMYMVVKVNYNTSTLPTSAITFNIGLTNQWADGR